jgi:anaerobic selenocysteine-containing dehydrogenase
VDFGASRYVIAFGADFLGTWNSPVAQSHRFGAMRASRGGRVKVVQVEPRLSLTGVSADEWVAAAPGTEGLLALGIAHAIIKAGLKPASAAGRAGALIDGWAAGLPAHAPEQVAQATGVRAATIERLAREFAGHEPAVALIGGAPLAQTNGLFQALAVNALNALVGSVNAPGGLQFSPAPEPVPSRPIAELLGGQGGQTPPKILIVIDANLAHSAPPAWKAREFLQQVPFIASFGSFLDDTTIHADLILPDHSFLESWMDTTPEAGAMNVTPRTNGPVMRPLYNTRAMPEVLFEVSGKLQKPVALPWPSWEEAIKAGGSGGTGGTGRLGGSSGAGRTTPRQARQTYAADLAQFDGDASQFEFHFLPYKSQALLDGSLAHLPWLQEMPDPMTSAMWSSWVEINPHTAERLHIADGDIVEVASAHGALRSPAVLSPGVAPNVIAMPMGQGHEHFTRYASGRGANPVSILGVTNEPETGALAWAATRVKIARVADGDGSLILFAGATRERPEGGR